MIFCGFLLFSCGPEPKETTVSSQTRTTTTTQATQVTSTDTDNSQAMDTASLHTPVLPPVKKPEGVYRLLLPYEGGKKVLHTVSFSSTAYRLQEEYPGKKDSVVVTEGTWAPSGGFIWLYRDQIARERYKWKGETLQYYNPQLKKSFSMEKPVPALANPVWQTKKKEGVVFYGVGNEPFWSVEVGRNDSLVLNMPDWSTPLKAKLTATDKTGDSAVYAAADDSLQVTVYPFFCSDGMSDFLYTQKVKVMYKGQTYNGCGELLRQSH